MANLSHIKGSVKEGQRNSKYYPTKTAYVEGLEKNLENVQGSDQLASQTENGLMSAADKIKLDDLENYSLPIAEESSLGGVMLYTSIGTNTNGTMTQKVITEELDKKADVNSPIFTGVPQAVTPDNDTDSNQLATTEFVQNLIRRLVGAAPETLDTLVELATAINNDKNFAETIVQALDGKLNKTDAMNTYLGINAKANSAINADSANYATSAGSATNDSAGNNISNTYAKKSEIPSGGSGVNGITGDGDGHYTFVGDASFDSGDYKHCVRLSRADSEYPRVVIGEGQISLIVGSEQVFMFKPDGAIYYGDGERNMTKITN